MVGFDLFPLFTFTGGLLSRNLQELPDYTSPPLDSAIAATPDPYKDDAYLDMIRESARNRTCSADIMGCQMLFDPPKEAIESKIGVKIGAIIYGGALVDPRAYSVMARDLANNYGFAVSIPIFENDVAFLGCDGTDRIPLAAWAFPYVEKWVLVGHSMGGIGLQTDVLTSMSSSQNDTETAGGGGVGANPIGGMVLLASYVNPICGQDFSDLNLPTAIISTQLDGVMNKTNFEAYKKYLPSNDTFSFEIQGGNHKGFGYYNDTLRTPILGQNDGDATIPEQVQQNLGVGAILHVASRMGLPLPSWEKKECDSGTTTTTTTSSASITISMLAVSMVVTSLSFFALI